MKFRTAFVSEALPGGEFNVLYEVADEIRFLAERFESGPESMDKVVRRMADYDPALDLIVPAGRAATAMLLGFRIGAHGAVNVAIYQGGFLDEQGRRMAPGYRIERWERLPDKQVAVSAVEEVA